jgi:hypothetical protein
MVGNSSGARRLPTSGRDRVPVTITTLARHKRGAREAYFFESHKQYGRVESYASGWLTSSPSGITIASASGGIYTGGETARRRGRALGVLGVRDGSVWIMEMRGYEGDSYDVVELNGPSPQILRVPGGGC